MSEVVKSMQRIKSIDILRGLTLIAMIIANNPGSWNHVYPILLESDYQGLAFSDLIFPTFIFTMGLSIPFALAKAKLTMAQDWKSIVYKIFKRTILLFCIGIVTHLLANYLSLGYLRIPGVLQRIALVYALCVLTFLLLDKLTSYLILALLAITLYWFMMVQIHPGFVFAINDPSANLGAYLDRLLLGKYIYSAGGAYHGYDPESLLGTISAYYNGMFGVIYAGLLKRYIDKPFRLSAVLSGSALSSIMFGLVALQNIPIVKTLWTPTYALISAGISGLIFIVIYWIFDRIAKPWFKIFENNIIPLGQNSILAYTFEEFIFGTVVTLIPIYNGNSLGGIVFIWLGKYLSLNNASLVCALFDLILEIWIMRVLYKKQVFFKV